MIKLTQQNVELSQNCAMFMNTSTVFTLPPLASAYLYYVYEYAHCLPSTYMYDVYEYEPCSLPLSYLTARSEISIQLLLPARPRAGPVDNAG